MNCGCCDNTGFLCGPVPDLHQRLGLPKDAIVFPSHWLYIERCDACAVYASDEAAASALCYCVIVMDNPYRVYGAMFPYSNSRKGVFYV